MIDYLASYLNKTLHNQHVEAIINGKKYDGIIEKEIIFEKQEPYYVMTLHIGNNQEEIPILVEKTIIRIGKTLFVLETEKHSTVIEIQS